jgi:uroporphyrinogen III methyltransferase/synthase
VSHGRVILVGAGPGDPGLITVRGAAVLRGADAVVYDALASESLLELAPPHAARINVGKRGHEEPTRTQEEINAILVSLAREGKTVVRLKGGDPFVFGRGGEEATACVEAGIPIEIVPGVSSVIGALAYAGIPVTDRRFSASFSVATGHKDVSKVAAETRWHALASASDTLVVLMGMRNLEEITGRLLEAGRAPSTPAAVIMNGTLPSQQVVEAPLMDLAERVREADLGTPAVVVIGEVVNLRRKLAWFETRPLSGRRVLVTRAADQAGEILEALRAAGAQAVHLPMIRIVSPRDFSAVDRALEQIDRYDVLLLTSANAARHFADRAVAQGVRLADLRCEVACVGPQTAEAARACGLAVHRVPEERHTAAGLLEEIRRHLRPGGLRFLLPRSERAREALAEGLRGDGARVDAVTVYRNLPPVAERERLCGWLLRGELDALTFTSPSTVQNFTALLDPEARAAAARCVVAAIGPITAEALGREGLPPDVVCERAGPRELLAALERGFAERGA